MSDHQEAKTTTFIPTLNPHIQEEATSFVAEMDSRQDDEMSVDSLSHEEKAPTIASGSLILEMETGTVSAQEEEVLSDRMSVDHREETPTNVTTSSSFDFGSLFQVIQFVAQSTPENNNRIIEIESSENETASMEELRDRVTEAEATQEEPSNDQEDEDHDQDNEDEPEVTVVEALLLSELEISTSNRIQMLSTIEHLAQSLADSNHRAPFLREIEHNVDTSGFVKTRKGKKASNAEGEDDSPEKITPHTACARCQHVPAVNEPASTLLTCGNCRTVQYCSTICQLRDWKAHRSIYCVNPINIPVDVLGKPHKAPFLMTTIVNPFARLCKGIWLHDRHKQDVYVLLIDSFRLREYDDYTFGGTSNADSVYSGRPSSLPAFRRFLYAAEAKGLMPPWWTDQKRVECLTKGIDRSADNWHDVHTMARDVDVVVVYEAAIMAMELRMFAETVLGSGAAGTDGRLLLQYMVVIEEAARRIVAKEAKEAKEKAAEKVEEEVMEE